MAGWRVYRHAAVTGRNSPDNGLYWQVLYIDRRRGSIVVDTRDLTGCWQHHRAILLFAYYHRDVCGGLTGNHSTNHEAGYVTLFWGKCDTGGADVIAYMAGRLSGSAY